MTNYPMTFTEAAKLAPDKLHRFIINEYIRHHKFLAALPLNFWPGGKSATYTRNKTLPTISHVDETDAISSTKPVREELTVKLSQIAGQIEDPIFIDSTMGSDFDQQKANIMDLIRAYALELDTMVITGAYNDTVTISAGGGTKGIDGCVAGPRIDSAKGTGSLKFDDTADTIAFRAPEDTALGASGYGTAVSTAADLDETILRSANSTLWIKLTMDVSDSEGNGDWEYTDALTFAKAKDIDGLMNLVDPSWKWYGNGHATTPSTNGDAYDVSQLDLILSQLGGNPATQCFVMRPLLGNAHMAAMRAAPGSTMKEWNGITMDDDQLWYRNRPIFLTDQITKTQTVGSSTACTSIFGCNLDRMRGVGLFYGAQRSRSGLRSQQAGQSDTAWRGRTITLPMFLRYLPERDDYATEPVRLTGSMAMFARASDSAVEIHGINNAT